MTISAKITLAAVGLGLAIAACSAPSEVDPPGTIKPSGQLVFLALPATAPPFFNDSASFYASNAKDSEGEIFFQDSGGGRGERFARLRIRKGALLERPDGTAFGPSDSVLIVIKVVAPNQVSVELRPSGLKFNAQDPAELKMEYGQTGGDLNGDGRTNSDDDDIEQRLAIWRQENLGDPLVKVGTVKIEGLRELEAELTSFSRYFIAY